MKANPDDQMSLFRPDSEQSWSYSRLKSLRRCPLEYKVRWLDGKEALFQPANVDVQAGRVLHHIAREYFRTPKGGNPHQVLLDIYKRVSPTGPRWTDDLRGEPRVLRDLQLLAGSQVAQLRAEAFEVGCKTRIAGVWFVGQADLVFQLEGKPGRFGILEFKLNDVEVRADDPVGRFLQCLIYYLGLPPQFRYSTEALAIYIFDDGHYIESRPEQESVDRAVQIVEATLQCSSGPDFPARLNPFCPSCGYQEWCPAYSRKDRRPLPSSK